MPAGVHLEPAAQAFGWVAANPPDRFVRRRSPGADAAVVAPG
ncbi:MAG: hypothetical protein JWO38_3148 [Gemmataceae bacterium]|nr:hypothetical protein [Gemmataceae bacterium]